MDQPELPFEEPIVKSYPVIRLSERAKPWITKAIKKHAQEKVIWDLAVASLPDPALNEGFRAYLALYLEIEGAVPNTSIYGSTVIAPFQLNSDRIDRNVRIALEEMRVELKKQQDQVDNPDPSV